MKLSPREIDHLTLSQTGLLAQRRLARGTRLSYSEAVALIAYVVVERARDGEVSVSELMDSSRRMLGVNNVMGAVPSLLHEVQVEATFPDGTKLVTVHSPINLDDGDLELALYGSFLPVPSPDVFQKDVPEEKISPGFVWTTGEDLVLNADRECVLMTVTNISDRPIQVGSHYHFVECNPYLEFDRRVAFGRRLNICSGTAIRFEPSETKTVPLVSIGGNKLISGGNALCNHLVAKEVGNPPSELMERVAALGFAHKELPSLPPPAGPPSTISRELYARTFGPTTGDSVRLGDTSLVLTVEKDLAGGKLYGEEVKFGGGKVIRDGMGQSSNHVGVDTLITNALIVDYTGIYKADVGISDGFICGIGKAGNPDTQDGVDESLVVGVHTEVIAGEGLILTAGGVDAHVHYICPQLAETAIASGITTLLGGGTGPATGTNATTCTPAPNHVKMMMQATDGMPLNFGFTGKGNCSGQEGLRAVVEAGACGLKLHEDWGSTPSCIDYCLGVAEEYDVQVNIHTDTLNESTMCEGSIAAFKGRTIHTYHSEGAGGGHAPDIIRVCGEDNVIPSSTNPTRPFTKNTIDEHLDMLMVCHHLDKSLKEDVAFAESRIRGETIAAEDILHDMGAISIISSDSQAMGRIGEVITRTWQTADKMKQQRGILPEDKTRNYTSTPLPDNERIKRFVAKYTINPAIAHGFSSLVGSVEIGKLADLVLWNPAFFGAKPELVIKGGYIAYAQMGDANASIPTPEPVIMRPQFGAYTRQNSYVFCSKASETRVKTTYGLEKKVFPVTGCRGLKKSDMKLNTAAPKIEVDSETYIVKADGVALSCAPIDKVALAQNYFMF